MAEGHKIVLVADQKTSGNRDMWIRIRMSIARELDIEDDGAVNLYLTEVQGDLPVDDT